MIKLEEYILQGFYPLESWDEVLLHVDCLGFEVSGAETQRSF